ncbi:MAG: hypothetical protein K6T99_06085 [Armatimonadetes bacterium]|nr:hypothetical protein [Armatimonadota bacterium]
MTKIHILCLVVVVLVIFCSSGYALVKMDEGRMMINGVQLLQDYADPKSYYYVPTYPRIAVNEDGTLAFLCLKYVDPAGKTGGGLFHALVEFTLPAEVVAELDKELKKNIPDAKIVGPVPLMQAEPAEGEDEPGSFEVVSAVLSDVGGFTRKVVTSGRAPITPGSRAAVAAVLNQQGATLLWDSLSGPTSDVSIGINAYYEAAVVGFDARITADVTTVYNHFSKVINVQQDYTRRQVRDIVDELRRNGTIKVEVLDRTKALDLKVGDLQSLVDTITNKIIELMFDAKTGFSADPPREVAVEQSQIAGRQSKGWLARLFTGTGDQKYYTDNQYVMKKREDIRQNTFSVILTKNSTVKVPVNTAGNIRGLYDALKDDPRYFRVINLGDPAFEFRTIYFQVDGDFASSFSDAINFVAVNVRKKIGDNPEFTSTLRFSHENVKDGKLVQEVTYPRLGEKDAGWLDYEYQVMWSVRNRDTISIPSDPTKWLKANDPAISLVPPFDKQVIEVDADRGLFNDKGVISANLVFEYPVLGEPKRTRVTLRARDTESTSQVTLYLDKGSKVKAKVTWYFKDGGKIVQDLGETKETYFVLIPPSQEAQS